MSGLQSANWFGGGSLEETTNLFLINLQKPLAMPRRWLFTFRALDARSVDLDRRRLRRITEMAGQASMPTFFGPGSRRIAPQEPPLFIFPSV
jgi:hypothetical protein